MSFLNLPGLLHQVCLFYTTNNKIVEYVIIKIFLNFSSKPEKILYHLSKFYTACKDSKTVSII